MALNGVIDASVKLESDRVTTKTENHLSVLMVNLMITRKPSSMTITIASRILSNFVTQLNKGLIEDENRS